MPLLEGLDTTGLALAILLPWLAGALATRLLLRGAHVALILGYGYVIGQLLVMVLILLWDWLGLSPAWWPLAGLLALLATVLSGLAGWPLQRHASARHMSPANRPRMPGLTWRDLLWLLPLLAFLGLRGSVLLQELALRPLYPWDAWMNWVPRAIVWFEHGSLIPFGAPEAWLQASPDTDIYTLGNRAASDYPPGIPLLLLWHMLGASTTDHTLIYLPWLLLPAALGLTLWGHLRACGLDRPFAAVAVYLLLSMPLPTTHAVLAGYADLWLGAAFALGAIALAQWQYSGNWRFAALALAMALLCAMLKNPGLGFAVLLVIGVVLVALRPPLRWLTWLVMGGLALLLLGLLAGLNPDWIAQFDALPAIDLPGALPDLRLRLSPLLPFLADSFYVQGNWHLLGVLAPAAILASLLLGDRRNLHDMGFLMLLSGFCMLLVVFGFTQYGKNLAQGVTLHRAFLYVTPLAVFVAFTQVAPLLQPQRPNRC